MAESLRAMHDRVHRAETEFRNELKRRVRKGMTVHVTRHPHRTPATVTDVYSDRVEVQSHVSGKRYSVYWHRIAEIDEGVL